MVVCVWEREREFRWQKRIKGKETSDSWEERWMWEKETLDDKSILIIIIKKKNMSI